MYHMYYFLEAVIGSKWKKFKLFYLTHDSVTHLNKTTQHIYYHNNTLQFLGTRQAKTLVVACQIDYTEG